MKVGYAAPGLDAQAEVVAPGRTLWQEVDPRTIDLWWRGQVRGLPWEIPSKSRHSARRFVLRHRIQVSAPLVR